MVHKGHVRVVLRTRYFSKYCLLTKPLFPSGTSSFSCINTRSGLPWSREKYMFELQNSGSSTEILYVSIFDGMSGRTRQHYWFSISPHVFVKFLIFRDLWLQSIHVLFYGQLLLKLQKLVSFFVYTRNPTLSILERSRWGSRRSPESR